MAAESRDSRPRSLYCEARFAHGAGLGTRLFPWARCKIFSELNQLPMLAPRWVQLRVGPLFRGGIQWQAYHRQILLVGQFRRNGYVSGFRRRALKSALRLKEPDTLERQVFPAFERPTIVCFTGYGDLFADLQGHRDFLLHALRQDARRKWVQLADGLAAPIGINVRCANDFRTAQSEADYQNMGALKTPLAWFTAALEFIRSVVNRPVPAIVVSDGTREQLQELLALPNVRFARPGSAIGDLLTLSQSKVLIGSGGSSFSGWASFLSGAPTITHPGQSLHWFKIDRSGDQCVTEFRPHHEPDPMFVRRVERALSQ